MGGDLEENGQFKERKCIAPECFSSMGGDLEENGHFKGRKCISFYKRKSFYNSSMGGDLEENNNFKEMHSTRMLCYI